MQPTSRPATLNAIIVFFAGTFLGTCSIWTLHYADVFRNDLLNGFKPSQCFGFLAADAVAMTLLIVAIFGLRRMRLWGFVVTQIEMGTWIYSSIGSLVMTMASGGRDLFVLLWAPVYLAMSFFVVFVTWRMRGEFR